MPFTSWQDSVDYPPLVIKRGSGIYLYDQDDTPVIDGVGSWWISLFGHNHPAISTAVKEQLEQIEHVMMAGCVSEPTLRMIDQLSPMLPEGLTKIFLSDNGSTSVEVGMKIALQYHLQTGNEQRRRFIAFSGDYHGDTLGAQSVGNIPQYHHQFHQMFKKELFTDPPNCFRCPCGKNRQTCGAECMDSFETLLDEHHNEIAAFVFEPMVQGAVGMRIYPPKVLKRCFDLCTKWKILTIADEVAMGFGRTGKMFACDHAGVIPDIMCLAKGLTGGYLPLATTIVGDHLFEAFKGDAFSGKTFEHGHTFTGNPLASAASCAALTLLKEMNIPESLSPLISSQEKLFASFEKYPIVGDIRTLGMVGAMELVADKTTKERLPAHKRVTFTICRNALKRGLLIRPLGDVIYLMLPYITTEEQLSHIGTIMHEAFRETIDDLLPDL